MSDVIKVPATLYLEVNLWHLFRKTCRELGLTPSHLIEESMRQQLVNMQQTPPISKEPDHA